MGRNEISFPAPVFPKPSEHHLGVSLVQSHWHAGREGKRAVPSMRLKGERWDPTRATVKCVLFPVPFNFSLPERGVSTEGGVDMPSLAKEGNQSGKSYTDL